MLTYSGEPRVITSLDLASLARFAENAGGVIAIECAVGETLVEDAVLLRVHGGGRRVPEQARCGGPFVSRRQDPKYAIRPLVDIAIRALSPAVNDPTTAVQAIDQIEDLLRRPWPPAARRGPAGTRTTAHPLGKTQARSLNRHFDLFCRLDSNQCPETRLDDTPFVFSANSHARRKLMHINAPRTADSIDGYGVANMTSRTPPSSFRSGQERLR